METKAIEQKDLARIETNKLIAATVAKGATQQELALFLYQARRTGLDPLAKQLYFIKDARSGRVMIQASIDGLRVVAQRSGQYAGQDEPDFTDNEAGTLEKCTVTVYRFAANGTRYPASVGVAYWKEYSRSTPIWTQMPHTMLAKVAEALALRKAFPQDLSGIYSTDEMDQANETPTPIVTTPIEPLKIEDMGKEVPFDDTTPEMTPEALGEPVPVFDEEVVDKSLEDKIAILKQGKPIKK